MKNLNKDFLENNLKKSKFNIYQTMQMHWGLEEGLDVS